MKFVWHHRIQHTHQFAWWSFQYWLIIITVFHPGLWLRDSMTKAARTNCQRILGKQSKAFELMQRGNWGKSSSKSPCFYSVVTRSTSSPHSWCLISRFHSAFFPPVSDDESETNKPLSNVSKAWAVICEEESFFLPPSFFISRSLYLCCWRCALHCYSIMAPMTVRLA